MGNTFRINNYHSLWVKRDKVPLRNHKLPTIREPKAERMETVPQPVLNLLEHAP